MFSYMQYFHTQMHTHTNTYTSHTQTHISESTYISKQKHNNIDNFHIFLPM